MHDDIDQLVALFLLLDLPTRFLLKNKDFEKHLYDSHNLLDTRIQELFLESAENMALINSAEVRVIDGWGNETNNIDVAGFINWSLHSSRFIKLLDNNSAILARKNKKIDKRSEKIKAMQKVVDEYIQEYFKNYEFSSKYAISQYIEKRIIEDKRLANKTLGWECIRKGYLLNSTVFTRYRENSSI